MALPDTATTKLNARERSLRQVVLTSQVLFWSCLVALVVWVQPFVGVGLGWQDYTGDANHHKLLVAVLLGVGCIVSGALSPLAIVARVGAQRDAMAWLATHDDLTDLSNRRHFYAELAEAAARAHERSFAVILLDLDGLKQTNDRFGHVAGDALILEVARCLRALAPGHLVARTGGDEFALLLLDATEQEAEELAAVLCRAMAATSVTVDEDRYETISVSSGVAGSDGLAGVEIDSLLRAADKRLYEDKRRRAALRAA